MLFELSLSLGYPHPDLMLDEMTAKQYTELLAFISARAEQKEQMEAEAQEARIMQHMARVRAAQEKENG